MPETTYGGLTLADIERDVARLEAVYATPDLHSDDGGLAAERATLADLDSYYAALLGLLGSLAVQHPLGQRIETLTAMLEARNGGLR